MLTPNEELRSGSVHGAHREYIKKLAPFETSFVV